MIHLIKAKRNLNSHSLVPVKHSAVKSESDLFGLSKWSIININNKYKYNRYMIKTNLDEISWIETDNKINSRKNKK